MTVTNQTKRTGIGRKMRRTSTSLQLLQIDWGISNLFLLCTQASFNNWK